MAINLTKDELKLLMDMVFMADWVMNSWTVGKRPETAVYGDLQQKLMQYAVERGLGRFIEDYEGELLFNKRFEDESPAFGFIDEYDDETMWEELSFRLAERDLREKYSQAHREKMDRTEFFILREQFREPYAVEFETNGLKNVRVVED